MTAVTTTYQSQTTMDSGAPRVPIAIQNKDSGPAFRKDIQGLRAVAVLLVVMYHAGVGAIGGGYVGVDVFFVVSGYLITLHLYRELEQTGRIAFGTFYGRRIVRLLPASTLVVLGVLAAAWHWMSPLTARAVSTDAVAAVGYAINVRLAVEGTDYLAAQREPSPLQHFWSLAVEEQFYLVWPLLLMLASAAWLRGRRPNRLAAATVLGVLATASLGLCVWQTGHNQPWAYFGIQARAWELATGALVALAANRLALLPRAAGVLASWAGLAAVLAAALLYTDATPFPGYAATLPVLGAALVIAGGCARPAGGVESVLRFGPLQELGRLSYSWYLWHWPVLVLAPHVAGHPVSTWTKLALMAAALIPASMSLAAVEDRIRFHHVFVRGPRRGLFLGAGVTVGALVAALLCQQIPVTVRGSGTAADTATLADAAAPSQLLDLIATSATTWAMPANLVPAVHTAPKDFPRDGRCGASLDATSVDGAIATGCDMHGDNASSTSIVLFGDSHADQWFDPVNVIALQQHWRLVVLTKSGCTPAIALTVKGTTTQPYTECTQWRESAFAKIMEIRPAFVIASSRASGSVLHGADGRSEQTWQEAWSASLQRIRGSGTRTIVVQDTPDLAGVDIPACVSAHPDAVQQCAAAAPTALLTARRRTIAAAANASGDTVIDPAPWFCTATACPPIVGNTLVYRDSSHVTATYMKLLAPLLAAQLR